MEAPKIESPKLRLETSPSEPTADGEPVSPGETGVGTGVGTSASLAATVYFMAQRLRRGVRPGLVRETIDLLDSSGEVLEAHVDGRLRAMYGPTGNPRRWLRDQPVLERTQVDDPAWDRSWLRRFRRLERKRSSGTVGQPVRVCKDMEMASRIDATMWALYSWHGVRPGMRHARFWGLPTHGWPRARRRALDLGLRRRRLSAFEFSEEAALRFFDRLRGFQPVYIHGYPSLVDEFASVLGRVGRDGRELGVKVIFLTGEVILDEVRRRVGEFFGARVASEYGCTESGLLAFDCEEGTSHEVPAAATMEVVRQDGRPADPQPGEALVTDLYGGHRPLVRYRLGDRVQRVHDTCSCGRELPGMRILQGRVDAFIVLPDGRRVFCGVLSHCMPAGVDRFQATQRSLDRLEVLVESRRDLENGALAELVRERVSAALGGRIEVDVARVSRIPRTPAGKHRYFFPLPST